MDIIKADTGDFIVSSESEVAHNGLAVITHPDRSLAAISQRLKRERDVVNYY